MKLKIKITGPKVHDVGYRYFLMTNAIDMSLRGFQARNRTNGKDQEVVALVEGDDEAIADFKDLVESKKPEHAKVSNIAFDDYQGDIMRTGEYAQFCSAQQLNKAIPVLLEIRDNTKSTLEEVKAVRKTGDETLSEIKAVRRTGDETLSEIKVVRKNTDAIPQVLDDLPGYTSNFRQMQSDIRAIKDRLGMS